MATRPHHATLGRLSNHHKPWDIGSSRELSVLTGDYHGPAPRARQPWLSHLGTQHAPTTSRGLGVERVPWEPGVRVRALSSVLAPPLTPRPLR